MPDSIPKLATLDSTRAFLREGHDFIGNRCRSLGTNAFRTRLMLSPVTCIAGEEAARRFYDGRSFTRTGAMPPTTLRLLQDKGSVQALDGRAHEHRKQLFLDLMGSDAAGDAIADRLETRWRAALPQWQAQGRLVLRDRLIELLFDTVCDWIGIPPRRRDAERQVQAMAWMIAQAGSIGPRTARALWRRRGSERWARRLIAEVRSGELPVDASTPLARLAAHRDPNGRALDLVAAGVELINIIRPTVAVARFITFAALAMHEHPGACDRLEDPAYRRAFAQEVRRFYPFFPVIGGRVLDGFVWQQRIFRRGEWVLLGLYATNHDPAIWGDPEVFRPARFLHSDPGAFRLVPQGAGDHHDDHRCPGEWLTLGLIDRAIVLLRNAMRYIVPPQDLAVPRDRFPTLPNSGLVLADVRAR